MNLVKVNLLADEKVINETLCRIGIANKKERILYPSCYLYSKDDEHYIVHFKEMFLLIKENGYNNISEKDIERRNSIIFNLKNWNLIDCDDSEIENHTERVFVLNHKEKDEWEICHKINLNNIMF